MLFNKKQTPVWILAVPRSASSFLVNFLNNTNLFRPRFREFNLDLENREDIVKNLPKHIKLQRTFFEKKGFSDVLDKKLILENFPNIKFIVTFRENILEQTVSTYFAEKTGIWFVKDQKQLEEYNKIKIKFDKKRLIELYEINLKHLNCWDFFTKGTNHIKISYENLIENQIYYFSNVCKFLKIRENTNYILEKTNCLKLKRKETCEYLEILKSIV